MNVNYHWAAVDENGGYIPQFVLGSGREQDLSQVARRQLSRFLLFDSGRLTPELMACEQADVTQHFDSGQQLVYAFFPTGNYGPRGGPTGQPTHLLGWQMTVGGTNVQHLSLVTELGMVEAGGKDLLDQSQCYLPLLRRVPLEALGVRGQKPAEAPTGFEAPFVEYTWAAVYRSGRIVTQKQSSGRDRSQPDLPREGLAAVALLNRGGRVIYVQHLEPGMRLIYRRRTVTAHNVREGQQTAARVCHLIGWQKEVAGQNLQHIAYCFEDGPIEMAGRFRDDHIWFRSINLQPQDLVPVVA